MGSEKRESASLALGIGLSNQQCYIIHTSHGTSTQRQIVRVRFGNGIGEAPIVPYYNDDPTKTCDALSRLTSPNDSLSSSAPRAAHLALDLLRQDLAAKAAGLPLWQYLGLAELGQGRGFVKSCRSLSIPSDMNAFSEKVALTAKQFPVLKLKLGSGDIALDLAIAKAAIEAAPHATIFADVNGGWSVEQALVMLPQLAAFGLAFIEQPISHHQGIEGWKSLRQKLPHSPLPLIADESAQTVEDLPALHGLVDGVNVKLLKAGSLAAAITMMRQAKAQGMTVLLGCMIESSLGVTAAAQLASLADWIDLDGHLYVANDDFIGLRYDDQGVMHLPQCPGIGAIERGN
jgi:L-Ala-D/L-Glu epimerase